MANVIEITSLDDPGLVHYTGLTQTQLRNRLEPEKGVFIAESPKVIRLALAAGSEPISFLMERKHITGQAADLCIDGDKTKGLKWFEYIRRNLPFDQLIWEHNSKGTYWVHVSFNAQGKNRRQVIDNLLKK